MTERADVTADEVERFLVDELGLAATAVERAGAGQWSECFGFVADGEDLVIRVGTHPDDFARDAVAHGFAGPDLPVPRVHRRGAGLGCHYAISDRARGTPLEEVEDWERVAEPVAAMLEAMRRAPLQDPGWGAWGSNETPPTASWRDFLLTAGEDPPGTRIHGWEKRLHADPARTRTFAHWCRALDAAAGVSGVPRSLLHCDLFHRNVHVRNGEITGVFDWGCSVHGDHLYELAQIEFWGPVLSRVRPDALRAALEDRWRRDGGAPARHDDRMAACHLHNGVVHLAYNAYLGDWDNFDAVHRRLREVLDEFG